MYFIEKMFIVKMLGYLCFTMKKLVLFLLLVAFVGNLSAQVETDKALHFLGGNLFGLAGAGIGKQISDGNRWWTFAGAIGGSALIGLGKEAIDSGQENNQWDNEDLLATILGGATVGITIDIFTDHKRKRRKTLQDYTLNMVDEKTKQYYRLDYLLQRQKLPSLALLSLPEGIILQ